MHVGQTEETRNLPVVKPERGRMLQLDGLRAIAILSVIASHSGFFDSGGLLGVHLFFVLSGFLITGILRRSREDEFFWSPFFIKRVTRIVPPLLPFYVFCAFTVTINWKTTGLGYIFFGASILQSLPHAQITELTVLWSLAVEEHFYFLWPFAVRYMSRRSMAILLTALLVLEPVARAVATPLLGSWGPIYFFTLFQFDGLAAGSLLALLMESAVWRAWLGRYALWAGVATAAVYAMCARNVSFALDTNSVLFNSLGYSLVVLACACALAYLYLKPKSWGSRVLSIKPIVFVGAISYGLYLFNGPVTHVLAKWIPVNGPHPGREHAWLVGVGYVTAMTLCWISFRFYETPIMRWGHKRASALQRRPRQVV